jgi:hypothetical protein
MNQQFSPGTPLVLQVHFCIEIYATRNQTHQHTHTHTHTHTQFACTCACAYTCACVVSVKSAALHLHIRQHMYMHMHMHTHVRTHMHMHHALATSNTSYHTDPPPRAPQALSLAPILRLAMCFAGLHLASLRPSQSDVLSSKTKHALIRWLT